MKKISFNSCGGVASLIIGNKWDTDYTKDESSDLAVPAFKDYLVSKEIIPDDIDTNYFANRIFFNWLNEINWKRVANSRVMYQSLFEKLQG